MNQKAEEFILHIRGAARMEGKPVVTTDSQLINPTTVADVLERAMIWLTPRVVETYDPAAFSEWSEDLRAELNVAVNHFRAVATTVAPDQPATALQAQNGVQAFAKLKDAVRKVALSEWLPQARNLINQIEEWAKEFGWTTRRQAKTMTELLLAKYELDQLYMFADGNLYILDPLARFIPGGLGAFDLSIQPSFYITSIYRHADGIWYVRLDLGQDGVRGSEPEPVSANSLRRAIIELRSLL